MHICFLCSEYPPALHGGLGSVMQTLGRALVKIGHAVTVVGFYRIPEDMEENDAGVRVVRLQHAATPRTGFVMNAYRLRRALTRIHSQTRIDVLEGAELSMALLPRSWPVVRVIRMHGGHHFFSVTLGKKPRPWRSWLERRSFRRADRLCAVSQFVADTTRELLNLREEPIEILENPVDTLLFSPQPDVPEDPRLIVFVGTVCEKKGIRHLIHAMPEVIEAIPGARLRVIGRDWTDSAGNSFTAQLRAGMPPGLSSSVEFSGSMAQSELPRALAQAAVCAYPSHSEAHSVACLEGMAMGKAVVVSNGLPFQDIVVRDVTGMYCDPHNPRAIAAALITLLKDPELRQRIGTSARAATIERYSVQGLAERNVRFYEQCRAYRNAHQVA